LPLVIRLASASKLLYRAPPFRPPVEPARVFLAVLGLAFAVAGVVVAWTVDKFAGLAVLVIGAFLLFLPFMRSSGDE